MALYVYIVYYHPAKCILYVLCFVYVSNVGKKFIRAYVIVYICPTLNKTFCILYFVVSALIDSEGECIAKSMSQEKTRSNHSKSPDSRVYIMSRNNKKWNYLTWITPHHWVTHLLKFPFTDMSRRGRSKNSHYVSPYHDIFCPMKMWLLRLWKRYILKLNCCVCYEQNRLV